MNLKSYYASTVESAVAQASRELGPDAMLVLSRETPAETRSWGRYEVVFGWTQSVAQLSRKPAASTPAVVSPAFEPEGRSVGGSGASAGPIESAEPRVYRARIHGRGTDLVERAPKAAAIPAQRDNSPVPQPPSREQRKVQPVSGGLSSGRGRTAGRKKAEPAPFDGPLAAQLLAEAGFSKLLAEDLVQVLSRIGLGDRDERFWAELAPLVPCAPLGQARPGALVFVGGPAGSGKTRSMARLALGQLGERGRLPHLICTDLSGLCGGHWLERLAQIAGAQFSRAGDISALSGIVSSLPAGGGACVELANTLGNQAAVVNHFRRKHRRVELLLTVPATYSPAAIENVFERFRPMGVDGLVATHVEDAASLGPVCSLASAHRIPLSWLSSSPSLEGGWNPASVRAVLGKTMGLLASQLASAKGGPTVVAAGGAR